MMEQTRHSKAVLKGDEKKAHETSVDVSGASLTPVVVGDSKSEKHECLTAEQIYANAKPKRTVGLRLFDIGLYPLLSNFAVFAVSVLFTFLTARGGDMTRDGKLVYGKFGEWFQKRGIWMEKQFQGIGMDQKGAEMSKVVAFSFIDGSIMSIPVKLLEDKREKIAHWIDDKLGTKPEKMTAYEVEPKQSWLSVLGGRILTAAIVVPTAMGLSQKVAYRPIRNPADPEHLTNPYAIVFDKNRTKNTSLNDWVFSDMSERHANEMPRFKQWFGKFMQKTTGVAPHETVLSPEVVAGSVHYSRVNQGESAFKTLARMTYFEGFYTSVCTAGLYFSSRILARVWGDKRKHHTEDMPTAKEPEVVHHAAPVEQVVTSPDKPHKKVHAEAIETAGYVQDTAHLHAQPSLQVI